MWTMFGCRTACAALASRVKRSMQSGSSISDGCSRFSATVGAAAKGLRAANTVPIPPSPSTETSSYSPLMTCPSAPVPDWSD